MPENKSLPIDSNDIKEIKDDSKEISKENVIVDVSIEEPTQLLRKRSKIINVLGNSKTLENKNKVTKKIPYNIRVIKNS